MKSISADSGGARRRRRLNRAIRESLRDTSVQLSLLNHQVGDQLDLKGTDLECLDLINRHGPLRPSGILDRLERGGWIARDRDPADRRGVVLRALRDRATEVFRLYSGMNSEMDQICAGYSDGELELLDGFLRRTAEAGRTAAGELADG